MGLKSHPSITLFRCKENLTSTLSDTIHHFLAAIRTIHKAHSFVKFKFIVQMYFSKQQLEFQELVKSPELEPINTKGKRDGENCRSGRRGEEFSES